MVTVNEIRLAQRAEGPATVLAIGTATPLNCVDQSTYRTSISASQIVSTRQS